MYDIVSFALASPLAVAGTLTVAYPVGRTKGDYFGSAGLHELVAGGDVFTAPKDFSLVFNANASNITLTWNGPIALPAGLDCHLRMDRRGTTNSFLHKPVSVDTVAEARLFWIDMGSPVAANDDQLFANAAVAEAGPITLIAAGQTFDVPRNVVVTSAGNDATKKFTVTGLDGLGNTVVEEITGANAAAAAGKKAFKSVASVVASAAAAGNVKIGTGKVLGLPVFLPAAGCVVRELQDGAPVGTGGTFVAGSQAIATATTGDVRGTYAPNAAPNADKAFTLLVALDEPHYLGGPQYAG